MDPIWIHVSGVFVFPAMGTRGEALVGLLCKWCIVELDVVDTRVPIHVDDAGGRRDAQADVFNSFRIALDDPEGTSPTGHCLFLQ